MEALSYVESASERLAESCISRNTTCSLSKTFVPINALPPEILCRVFEFSTIPSACSDVGGEHNPLVTIPFVCTRWVNPSGLRRLLPTLFPGVLKLGLRCDLWGNHEIAQATRSLFRRSNVVSLCLWEEDGSSELLAQHLSSLPNLHVLFLECSDRSGSAYLSALTIPVNGRLVAICPQLQILRLMGGVIVKDEKDQIKRIAKTHSLHKIIFADGGPLFSEDKDYLHFEEWLRCHVGSVVLQDDVLGGNWESFVHAHTMLELA
jgi:hypothetical protein